MESKVIIKKALEMDNVPAGQPAESPAATSALPDEAQQAMDQTGGGTAKGTPATGWVRLEEVIGYLQNVDKNRAGHDVEIAAKSNTSGVHKFEITVKEKPMMNKANGMGQAAAVKNVEVKKAMKTEEPKSLKTLYPDKFLKAMGL